ncbi:Asp-tRNA(Asn)/Glu-tRNA(Gln) amidotransferase subunit GatA [bacterium]|nr:Asp-tRNA(Asn)/Glu-tRNA(Gln) amidotransferase subunit GatA [bacterium]
MSELPTITELISMLHQKKTTSAEVISGIKKNVDEYEPSVNAFINLFLDEALREAKKADEWDYMQGKTPGLAGIPIAVKDNICVKDKPCTCASRILEGFVSPYDATVIKRLKKAGAIIVGKTNMDEFAMGASNETSAYGPVRNPLNTDRVPGGSSGGSAAAVAYGAAVAALGSDTGGSVRQPASFCGLVGFRPSYGRVSRYGLVAFSSSLDQIGPITKNVEDAALIYSIIAGPDVDDSTTYPCWPEEVNLTGKLPDGVRIGVIKECFDDLEDNKIKDAILSSFKESRITLIEVSLPLVKFSISAYYLLAMSEASSNLARYDGIRYGARTEDKNLRETYFSTRGSGFGKEVKRRILVGTFGLSAGYIEAYYNKALAYRASLAKEFDNAFKKVDFLLSPTAPTPAFKLGEKIDDPLQMYLSDIYTTPAALAGLPAISIPAKEMVDGLPIGIHIVAPRFKDSAILEFAHAIEKI